jgi:DNA-binding NarL/FixJ family response regulator
VLCVDDHPFVAEGLQSRFSAAGDLTYVGSLASADSLVEEVKRTGAEIVLMDISLPGKDPFEAVDDLRRQQPHARVIMLSAHVRDHYLDAAVNAGAWGYLSKSDDPQLILDALRAVHRGEFAFSDEVKKRCGLDGRQTLAPGQKPHSRLASLTQREQQVLRMIGRGLSRAEIAAAICRSPKTVDAHTASVMDKMDVHDRVSLARLAIREGLVEA